MRTLISISFLACFVFLLQACSRDKKLNTRLDGSWEAEQFLGVRATKNTQFKLTFEKDAAKEGYGVMYIRSGSSEYTEGFTYTIDNENLNLFSENNFYFFRITSSSKKRMTLIDQSDKITVLEKE